MQSRISAAVAAPVLLVIAGFTRPAALQAQVAASPRPVPAVIQLGALSRERAARWAEATPAMHCSPAPLTERPDWAAQLARPHVAPLEEAFLDARTVKRTFASRPEPRQERAR